MNKVGIILLLWACCAISVFADTVSADSLTLDSVPTAEAINLAELHALSVHHRSDVRHMRDSLKQNMRMVRKSMHHDVQRIRDSLCYYFLLLLVYESAITMLLMWLARTHRTWPL